MSTTDMMAKEIGDLCSKNAELQTRIARLERVAEAAKRMMEYEKTGEPWINWDWYFERLKTALADSAEEPRVQERAP